MDEARLVMVVDDEKVIRDILCRFLEKNGYRTMAFGDGTSVISQTMKEKPDAILMDLKMPGLNGFGACSKLEKVLRSGPRTGIFIVSAYDFPDNIERACALNAIDVIKKPFDLEDVRSRLDTWFHVRDIENDVERAGAYAERVHADKKKNGKYKIEPEKRRKEI